MPVVSFQQVRRSVAAILSLGLLLPASGQVLFASGQAPGATPVTTAAVQQAVAAPSRPVRRISVDDAVRLALEQNLSIQVQRVNPQIQDLSVAQIRTFWTPNLTSSFTKNNQATPPSSFLSGGQSVINDNQFSTNVGVNQLLPWGGNYSVAWDSSRATSTNSFNSFNPLLRSNLSANVTQPLMRNFTIDSVRQQLLISKKTREISDVQLRDTVVSTLRTVKNAYWDLVYANASLAVQRQSLDLARESLRNNRTRVEVGTMAPIDIVEAESEVARNDEAVIVAEAEIQRAEDQLRALIYDPSTPDFWNLQIEPTDPPALQTRPIDIDAAVRNALDKRTDIAQAKKTLESSDISIRYFHNQMLPDLNLVANYGLAGLGGTQFEPFDFTSTSTLPRSVVGQRSFGGVLSDIFKNDFPTWTLGVTIGYPIGRSNAEANLARAKLQYSQSQTQLKSIELNVTTQVRDLGRQVNTNLKRVEATRVARQLAERRLEAEQKKFSVGMSTSFIVFQAQRDLSQARNAELRAILDYNRSSVDFEAIQEAAINGAGTISGVTTTTSTTTTVR